MFEKEENPGYQKLSHDAAGLIAQWMRGEWYEGSGAEELDDKATSSVQSAHE